jgi:hypothetical protein
MTEPIKVRNLYAFTKHRRGDFILLLDMDQDVCTFMQLPDRYKIFLTKKEVEEGITTGLLDFVENIPEDVFEVSKANAISLEKSL